MTPNHDKHEGKGTVARCARCLKSKSEKKPCPTWVMHGRPDQILNCRDFRDEEKRS